MCECPDLGVGGWGSTNPNVVRICKFVWIIGRFLILEVLKPISNHMSERLKSLNLQNIKDQIKIGAVVRIWGTHPQNRQNGWQNLRILAMLEAKSFDMQSIKILRTNFLNSNYSCRQMLTVVLQSGVQTGCTYQGISISQPCYKDKCMEC